MLLPSVPIFAFTAGGTLVLSWPSRRPAAMGAGGFSFRKRGIMIAAEGVEWLREAGWTDQQGFAATAFVTAWLAFSTLHASRERCPMRSWAPEFRPRCVLR